MKNEIKLSIGVPTFNQASFIRYTLNSLINQSAPPYEIVVSDNCSTDGTKSVLAEYEGRVKIVRPHVHLEMMAHWNFLASQLNGNWFSLLSSDDIANPNYVHSLLRGIRRSKKAVLIRGGWENIDVNGGIKDKRYLLSVKKVTSPPQTLYEQLIGPKMNFAAFAVRKEIWMKVGGFPEECALNGDWGFWLKISPYGNFIYEHEIISQYRTDYRPELERIRLLRELQDELFIFTKIIPEATQNIPNINHAKIAKATRLRFKKRISQASNWLTGEERSQAAYILEEWNSVAMCDKELGEFKSGKQISYQERFSGLKKIARLMYSWLR